VSGVVVGFVEVVDVVLRGEMATGQSGNGASAAEHLAFEIDLAAETELLEVGERAEEDGRHDLPARGRVGQHHLVVHAVALVGDPVDLIGQGEVAEIVVCLEEVGQGLVGEV
jgi:hypothetical protein